MTILIHVARYLLIGAFVSGMTSAILAAKNIIDESDFGDLADAVALILIAVFWLPVLVFTAVAIAAITTREIILNFARKKEDEG